ncbi:hypothetical protein LDO32_04030 [Luteimonas sp. Y-2-2-4F]|nr:hypothetical protein [Luteimonas sp. Y-2-2-4F]MCD9030902.1 hypothetical protein [Luteimonas sp. Y-2-2-4F]
MTAPRPLILSHLPHDLHAHAACWGLRRIGADPLWIRSWDDPRLDGPSLAIGGAPPPDDGVCGHGAVWFRRPRAPETFPGALEADQAFLRTEWGRYAANLHAMPGRAGAAFWVNRPDAAIRAENKLVQLDAAQRCGLRVPETLISRDPAAIRRFVARHGRVVYKPFQSHGWIDGEGRVFGSYARVVGPEALDDASLRQCPGIFQQPVDKRYDVRVTVIGAHAFAMRLDTPAHEDAIDWRAMSLGGRVEAAPFALPEDCAGRLHALMDTLGLAFGCADFVADDGGALHFLEVNQAGQFLFAEQMLPCLPLLAALCAMLAQARPDYTFDEAAPGPRYADYLASDEHRAWWAEVSPGIRGADGAIPGLSPE